jgi:hypothetical protein
MHKPNLVRRPAQGEKRGHETRCGACRVACGCPLSQKGRAPRLPEPALDSVGGWGHSSPVQALCALVLVQAVVAATKVSLKGRPEEHRAVTRAESLCWQMKMSKTQKEEHMQAALRPATERFVGYSPAMQKMISSQLAQVTIPSNLPVSSPAPEALAHQKSWRGWLRPHRGGLWRWQSVGDARWPGLRGRA